MKIGLPLKLGILVVALFALVIAGCLLYRPLRFRYWRSKLHSENAGVRKEAVQILISMAPIDQKAIVRDFIKASTESRMSVAIVLENTGWIDFDLLDRRQFMDYANALIADKNKYQSKMPYSYRKKAWNHLYKIRPSGRHDKYYDLFYRLGDFAYQPPPSPDKGGVGYRPFLRLHQVSDGRWTSEDGTRDGDLITSGLTMLVFMWRGYTHKVGRYRRSVRKGLEFLKKQIDSNGEFSESTIPHAICTLALCELFAVTRDKKLKEPAQKVLRHLLLRQLPGGGFPAKVGESASDNRATFYSVLALKSASMGKLDVSKPVFENIIRYIDNSGIIPVAKEASPGSDKNKKKQELTDE